MYSHLKNVKLGVLCKRNHDHGGGSYRHKNGDCVDCLKSRIIRWQRANPIRLRAANVKWRETDPERTRSIAKEWRLANLDRVKELISAWEQDNYDKVLAKAARRRAKKRQAYCIWADKSKVLEFYSEAVRLTEEMGTPYEVDHIIPLQNSLVCGLHNEFNLQVLSRAANRNKAAKFIIC